MTPLFLGNWKMHVLPHEVEHFVRRFLEDYREPESGKPDTGFAPPAVTLPALLQAIPRERGILVGAQNVHWAKSGAHTGEISTEMLTSLGVGFVLVGHSERRQFYGENDTHVGMRTQAALSAGLMTVVCIGETEAQFNAKRTEEIVEDQLQAAIAEVSEEQVQNLVVAYEPVWAIGTGLAATPEQVRRVHTLIRTRLLSWFGDAPGASVRIIYGGSINPENVAELMCQPNVEGALVGGASLKPDVFNRVIGLGRTAFSGR